MDLRGTQSHFIAAIRGGEVINIANNAQRMKGPKFRGIEEIYISHDSNCHDSITKYPPKVNRSLAMPCGWEKVKTEVKSEYIEKENELDFGDMTLRQFKNICKSHKRKASRSINLTTFKEEVSDLRSEVDDLDLKETLGSWKCKVLKKTKTRKKVIFKHSSKSSTTNKLSGSLDNKSANLALLDISSESYMPLKIKVEDEEYEFSAPQAKGFVHESETLTSEVVSAFEHCCPNQDLKINSGYQGSGFFDQFSHTHFVQPVSITKSTCCLNQVSYEHLDYIDTQNPLISEYSGIEETIEEDKSVVLSEKPLVFGGSEVKREVDMTDLMGCDEPITALLEADGLSFQINHPSYGCQLQPFPYGNGSSEVAFPCMALNGDCQDAEFTNSSEVSTDDNRDIEEVVRRNVTNFNSIVKLDNYIHSVEGMPTFVVEDKQLSVLDVTSEEVQKSPMGPKRKFQDTKCLEIGEDSGSMMDIRSNAKNFIVAVQDEISLPLVNSVEPLHDVASAIDDKQSSPIDTSIATLSCSPDIQPCIVDQQIGSVASEGLYENKLEQQLPERLFSARKTISPNSKERLRRALISAEMQDDKQILFSEGLKAIAWGEKLYLEKDAVDTSPSRSNFKKARIILTPSKLQALHMTQSRPNNRPTLKKWKNEKKVLDIKGTVPHLSSSSVEATRACSSSRSCSQNAIAFSQQQMVDIERLAMKLLRELQTMKEMVVDTLHSDSRTCPRSKFNTDKSRVAVENVKKVEDTTKRWLSMMARDCNRFCKIMEISERKDAYLQNSSDEFIPDSELCQNNIDSETKLDEQKASPPKSRAHKERKIMFADEAGESLCHIRVL